MKLDIVRTWKDESYRQELSEEQLNMLSANPSGELELSDAQLESIYGGDGFGGPGGLGGGGPVGGPGGPGGPGPFGGPFGGPGGGLGVGGSFAGASSARIHSFSVICDINVFSINVSLLNIISIASNSTQVCLNAD